MEVSNLKKIAVVLLLVVVISSYSHISASANTQILVIVDGNKLEIEPGAYIIKGTTYVPLVPFCNALGANIDLSISDSTNSYVITKYGINREVRLETNSKYVNVNGITRELDIWPLLIAINTETKQEITLVPLVFLIQQFGGVATWNPDTREISVNSYVPVYFKDNNLESAVREQLKVYEGDIFKSDVDSIEMLIVPGKAISDLDGMQYFENLTYLDISNNLITDVTPLRKLSKLSSLFIKGNNIQDDSPISAVYNKLKERDFSLVPKFHDKNLENAVRKSVGKDSGALSLDDLSALTDLKANENNISSLQGIQYLVNLTELNLSGNSIENIAPLESLTDLKKLSLSYNSVKSIDALSSLKNLEYLDLDNNNVSDFSPLEKCVELKQLSMLKNNFSDDVNVFNLANLETLDLGKNKITQVNGLENLANLKKLYLNINNISNVSEIQNNTSLELLDLSQNNIQTIEPLSNLYNLKALYLSKNKITDTSAFGKLNSLKVLDLSENSISQLSSHLSNLSGLNALYLEGNKISTFSPIKDIAFKLTDKDFETDTIYGSQIVQSFYIDQPFYFVNGQKMLLDSAPFIKDNRTYLPVRSVSETVGASVEWDSNARMITIKSDSNTIRLWIDEDQALVNSSLVKIDAAPFIQNGRTMLPIRFVAENLGMEIEWNQQKQEIILTK